MSCKGVLKILVLGTCLANTQAALTTYFQQPPAPGAATVYENNDVLSIGSQFQLKWVTFQDNYSIWLWQQNLTARAANAGSPIFTKTTGQTEPGTTNWVVSAQDFDLNQSNVFYFALGPNITLQGAVTCHYFNLSSTSVVSSSSSTIAIQSATPTSNPSSTGFSDPSTTTTSSTSSISSSRQDSTDHNSSDDLTYRIGLGVGLGVGTPILLLLCILLVWKFRSRRANLLRRQQQEQQQLDTKQSPAWAATARYHDSGYVRQELPAQWEKSTKKERGNLSSSNKVHEMQ